MPLAGARQVIAEGSRKAPNIHYKVNTQIDTGVTVSEVYKFLLTLLSVQG